VIIALATCMPASYDQGFEKVAGKYSLEKYLIKIEESVRFNNARRKMKKRKGGRTSYTDLISSEHPEYLHEMFHQAIELALACN
jgi:hypothetical protein